MFELYLITKPNQNLLEIVVQVTQCGVTMVQLRDKNISDEEMIAQAMLLRDSIPKDIPIIINDRLSVARKVPRWVVPLAPLMGISYPNTHN